jgi:hypothetical protein
MFACCQSLLHLRVCIALDDANIRVRGEKVRAIGYCLMRYIMIRTNAMDAEDIYVLSLPFWLPPVLLCIGSNHSCVYKVTC